MGVRIKPKFWILAPPSSPGWVTHRPSPPSHFARSAFPEPFASPDSSLLLLSMCKHPTCVLMGLLIHCLLHFLESSELFLGDFAGTQAGHPQCTRPGSASGLQAHFTGFQSLTLKRSRYTSMDSNQGAFRAALVS